jgi:phosphatidylglycerol---prolipoprotein diacylglyceryl transferase
MYPILFEINGYSVYTYGFMIAIGTIAGVAYLAVRGKKELGLTFDQANSLFLYIFFAALIGGKVFLFFENPSYYVANFGKLVKGSGFVFYGSFLFAVPVMLWFFRKHKLDSFRMLDIMAVTTCLVHMFGRVGCFFAGCCHGKPTDFFLAATFTDPACYADPKGVPLHPAQLYEAGFILLLLVALLFLRDRRKFYGQLFLIYLIGYGIGRFLLEYLRGDTERGFIIENVISHSQLIALMIVLAAIYVYYKRSVQARNVAATR